MKKIFLDIEGMHCTSCAFNIDGELEDRGVKSSSTNYAKSQTIVEFEEGSISQEEILDIIKKVGYTAKIHKNG